MKERPMTMEELRMMFKDEAVHIKVFDKRKGDVVFVGNVSTDLEPGKFMYLRCFVDRNLLELCNKAVNEKVVSFFGLKDVELFASAEGIHASFWGVLYSSCHDGVIRMSARVPQCACVSMSVWSWFLSFEECQRVFLHDTLEELDINQCGLTDIPRHIGNMSRLRTLKLFKINHLMTVPEEIGHLASLKELVIQSCGIVGLPGSICGLTELERLKLVDLDNLEELPEEFGELASLKTLKIRGCPIPYLPKSFGELKVLESLDLLNLPNLQLYPEDFKAFFNLKKLRIKYCEEVFKYARTALESFCEILKMTLRLRSLEWDWTQIEDRKVASEALEENGSIVHGSIAGLNRRNKTNHNRAMESTLCLSAIRKWKRGMSGFPKEIVEVIARMLWITRYDAAAW